MTTTRRSFLYTSALGTLGGLSLRWAGADAPQGAPGKGKKLLIIGGTGFLGPALVAAARAQGYTLTLFNRGKTRPGLFPDIETIQGDRNKDLDKLKGRTWDAVIDTPGYVPAQVRASANALKDAVGQYVFISTISVFTDTTKPGLDETSPVGTMDREVAEKAAGRDEIMQYYGPLKALCEQEADKAMSGRALVVRPGLIVGPGDPTDRFTYWPVRVARGGEVLAPGDPKDPTQFIDVRDLAEWIVRMVDAKQMGTFNATGPKEPLPIGDLLAACRKAVNNDAKLTFIPADFLEQQKVAPWEDLPVWVPPVGEYAGASRVSVAKAIGKGLVYRPVETTCKDTLAWWNTLPAERRTLRTGIKPEREAEVLKAWHGRQPAKP